MRSRYLSVLLHCSALAASLLPLAASAQTPALINYQGRLLSGTNLVNGSVGLSLRLFDASAAGTLLYEDSNTVTVTDGLYATLIGDGTTFGTLQSALENSNVWVEVAVNDTALTPRERLVSAAYAVKSRATEVFTGAIADGQLSTNIARLSGSNQTFSGPVRFTSVSNSFAGVFSGNAGSLTNIQLTAVIASQSTIFAWGESSSGQTSVPDAAMDAVAVAACDFHCLALLPDGSVVAWGRNNFGQLNVPGNATNIVAIAGGSYHSLGLRDDGSVLAWGRNDAGQSTVPATATGVVAIAGGVSHSLALRADGTVNAWGDNSYGQTNVPVGATGLVAIAAGGYHSLGLRADGTVLAWGRNNFGQSAVPATVTGVVALAAGYEHSLALCADGKVNAWGGNSYGQTNVPVGATGLVAVTAGLFHNLALRADGTIVGWGYNIYGQAVAPLGTDGSTDIDAGGNYSVVRRPAHGKAQVALLDRDNKFAGRVTAYSYQGDGGLLFNLTAEAIAGTLADAQLSTNVALRNSGTYPDARLSTNVALLNAGTYPDARLSTNMARLDAGTYPDERLSTNIALLNAGTYPDARLSTNVALLNTAQTFSATQRFAAVTIRPPTNVQALFISGGRTGNFPHAVAYIENTNTTASGSTLRLVGSGSATDGVLSVSSLNSQGNIARFGNATSWVAQLDYLGNLTALSFNPSSDRQLKENFSQVDVQAILEKVAALPIAQWNYKTDTGTVHIGPMAQDFHAAFGVGPDDKHIATVDADGVALAAIQGLEQVVTRLRQETSAWQGVQGSEVGRLKAENEALKRQLEDLASRLRALEAK